MLVTLYTSRVILNTLGVEDYGIYNVVGGVVAMFAFFNNAMSAATQRFLSYELGKGDFIQLKKTFNASQVIHIGIAIFILVFAETLGLWFIKNYLVIPAERMKSALWVYHFSVLSFMVTIIQVPYNATIIAHEKMNIYAYVSILEVSLKLLIAFMLTWISFDKLSLYGILQFCVVFLIATIYRMYVSNKFEESKFLVVKDKNLYRTLMGFSVWSLFGSLASVTRGQGVNIILNMFFGPAVNAARGIAIQIQGAVNSFVSNFQMAVRPQIIKSYAADEKDYMTSLVIRSSKFSFYLLFLISLPIILEVNQILELWLKTVPDYASVFTVLVLITILISCVSEPLMTTVQASGKIKVYQAVVGSLQILILPISYVFLKFGYSPEITLYIAIVIEVIALYFRLLFLKKIVAFPIKIFINEIIIRNIFIVTLSVSIPLFVRFKMDTSILRLFVIITISIIWSGFTIYFVGLNKEEKKMGLKVLSKVFKKSDF